MRKTIKIDPYHYPLILIVAFVLGFTLALALGFGPQHGSQAAGGHGQVIPTGMQILAAVGLSGL